MVHHLRDADRRSEIHVKAGVGQGAPGSAGVNAGLDLDALGERDRTGVENGVRIEPAAGQARVGAVERVVNRRRRGRDRQRVAGTEQAAVLGRAVDAVGGRVDARIQPGVPQLLDHDVRPLRQPRVEHVIAAVHPVGGPIERAAHVAPARRFGNDGLLDFVGQRQVAGLRGGDGQRAAVEQELLRMVGKQHAEIGVVPQRIERRRHPAAPPAAADRR